MKREEYYSRAETNPEPPPPLIDLSNTQNQLNAIDTDTVNSIEIPERITTIPNESLPSLPDKEENGTELTDDSTASDPSRLRER